MHTVLGTCVLVRAHNRHVRSPGTAEGPTGRQVEWPEGGRSLRA